ncbi:hypothetical protein HPB48_017970 [Haemaphysalis longicornis]|uniref:Uncharacterized protein n=1 Tax=Haemaphysalis longicornis TaxID=44386 RepID=A0A9J6FQ60_HAELO|nr:hypothetical protein HPB48_017970 [Haemaphysalis longicornis]
MRIQKQLAWKNQDLKDLKDKDEAQRTTERNYGFDEAPSLFTQTKQAKGIHYARTWVMNCLLLRIASPKAYNLLRSMKLLPLPTCSRLNQILEGVPYEYGYNEVALGTISASFSDKPAVQRYGTLILDEIKLKESVDFNKSTYKFDGFVNFSRSQGEAATVHADHALVIMFIPLFHNWVQPVASFATRGAAPGFVLAKLVLECVIELERHNASVIAVAGPHCINFKHYEHLYKTEEKAQLKVVPKLTASHVSPGKLEKMNVRLATQLFSRSVALGLRFYREQREPGFEDTEGTERFTALINELFDVLNAKIPVEGIRKGSPKIEVIRTFLCLLNTTEEDSIRLKTKLFASQMTTESLRVTLMSVLDIIILLHDKDVIYVLTAKLNQDPLERFFGVVRGFGGDEDHPAISHFSQIFRLLSLYTPLKMATKGNCSSAFVFGSRCDVIGVGTQFSRCVERRD